VLWLDGIILALVKDHCSRMWSWKRKVGLW